MGWRGGVFGGEGVRFVLERGKFEGKVTTNVRVKFRLTLYLLCKFLFVFRICVAKERTPPKSQRTGTTTTESE